MDTIPVFLPKSRLIIEIYAKMGRINYASQLVDSMLHSLGKALILNLLRMLFHPAKAPAKGDILLDSCLTYSELLPLINISSFKLIAVVSLKEVIMFYIGNHLMIFLWSLIKRDKPFSYWKKYFVHFVEVQTLLLIA